MMLDGSRRQEELVGNFGVGETLVEELENFGLTGGETGVVTPGCHGAGSLKPLSMCCDSIISHGVKSPRWGLCTIDGIALGSRP